MPPSLTKRFQYCPGNLECARLLLEAGASVRSQCEGSLPIHIATCTGDLPGQESFAAAAVELLLKHGAEAHSRCVYNRLKFIVETMLGLAFTALYFNFNLI